MEEEEDKWRQEVRLRCIEAAVTTLCAMGFNMSPEKIVEAADLYAKFALEEQIHD